jgi:DNA-binding XRE family transcriptional regulator
MSLKTPRWKPAGCFFDRLVASIPFVSKLGTGFWLITRGHPKFARHGRAALIRLLTGLLLGIAQRTVMVFFDCPSQRFRPRKLMPVNVKTLGDQLHLARIKANLSQSEVVQKLRVSTRTVRKWEYGHSCPTEDHWQVLVHLLGLDCLRLKGSCSTPE